MTSSVHGPFHTHQDLATATRPLEDALRAADPGGALAAEGRRARANLRFHYLLEALRDTGVDLGNGDIAVARVLAGATVETLVVVADWLARANAAGNVELLAEAAEYIEACRPGPGGRCEHGAWAQCRRTDVAWRLRGIDPAAARAHAASGGE
jgi:hypothetical protein